MQRTLIPLLSLVFAAGAMAQQSTPEASPAQPDMRPPMQRFIIERDVPGAGRLTLNDLRGSAAKSNSVLRAMGPDIQWVHSYIAGDKIYCVYNATSEALIREHAARGGFAVNKITPVSMVVDPTTAGPAH